MALNEASSSHSSSAPLLLEQVKPKVGKASSGPVLPESSQSYVMTPVGNSKHRVVCQDRARGQEPHGKKHEEVKRTNGGTHLLSETGRCAGVSIILGDGCLANT